MGSDGLVNRNDCNFNDWIDQNDFDEDEGELSVLLLARYVSNLVIWMMRVKDINKMIAPY
ncbi:hypothetical protein WICANDRAFT_88590 [Wickerhamomyces anomalus NRRL Y-366-8]|uniref:Uncharacterized protein n=1 Tax=Wickerhamomyces anomalus (strain ATCC 58044 / CBS 1984 / NCYC 433 / NRRL Y-366-8) TaxID=683960 RepID=A0A1E3PBM9_WICAA|nr:uncharacterized protein WICANDRAFT_88590 [Wickerhamomyces anomalus NRRL Y-366-8]ODQ62781.1 hypothetical protein WICANDRAFT_88590 [Wickerhamomyces anomalus NRRL Y-366-8]